MEPILLLAPRMAAFVFAVVVVVFAAACGDGPPAIVGAVETETLHSDAVGDDYLIQVRLPPGYDASGDTRYPVVFQLDGTNFGPEFAITAGLASELEARGAIRDVIVVGVGYPYDDPLVDPKRGRMRDYVIDSDAPRPARGDHFLTFLETELVPHIDAAYRVDTQERYLSGHSLGGFFALHVLFTRGAEESPVFAGFVAGDPSLGQDDLLLFEEEEALRATAPGLRAKLFVPVARYDGAAQRLPFEELDARLRRDFPDLVVSGVLFDTDHAGVIEPGFEAGLLFLLGVAR